MSNWIRNARLDLARRLASSELRWLFSPLTRALRRKLVPLLRQHIGRRVLDVGCGRMPFRTYLTDLVDCYDGLDREQRGDQPVIIGDAQNMSDVPSDAYDSVLCLSVMEHLQDPELALREMKRVCRPDGCIILEVPHLSRYHELPHDYQRFTEPGLRVLAGKVGLRITEITPTGGLFAFLGHQFAIVLVCSCWPIPVLRWLVFWVNFLLLVLPAVWLDRLLGTERLFPASLSAVLRVPRAAASASLQ